MIRSATRTILHAALLAMLVAGVAYAVMMSLGTVTMVAMPARRAMLTALSPTEVALGTTMAAMWGGVVGVGAIALFRQIRRNRALAGWVDTAGGPPSPPLAAAAEAAGRPPWLVEIPANQAFAFTHGIWRPRIVVSSGLVRHTTADELTAVMAHEASHVRHRDPLKILAFRTWSAALGFLPVARAVFRGLLDRQEIRADRAALRTVGAGPVAGALLKAVDRPDAAPGTTLAAIGGRDLLEQRVAHLETNQAPGALTAVPRSLAPSTPGFAAIALYVVAAAHVCSAASYCCWW